MLRVFLLDEIRRSLSTTDLLWEQISSSPACCNPAGEQILSFFARAEKRYCLILGPSAFNAEAVTGRLEICVQSACLKRCLVACKQVSRLAVFDTLKEVSWFLACSIIVACISA